MSGATNAQCWDCRTSHLASSLSRNQGPLEVIVVPGARESKKGGKRSTTARCRTCGKAIRVPQGWGVGPAVRRHYWAKHPEVMQKSGRSRA
jgi:hypothetical protein